MGNFYLHEAIVAYSLLIVLIVFDYCIEEDDSDD